MIKLYDLSIQGYSIQQAADALGMSYHRAKYIAERCGIKFNGYRRKCDHTAVRCDRARGLTLGQIAMRHSVSVPNVSRICRSSSDER